MIHESERRHYPRAEIEWPAKIRQDGFFVDGVTKNLSHGGALVSCSHYMYPGEKVRVAVMLVDRLPLVVDAEVVRCAILGPDYMCGLFGTAVRFISISAEDLYLIDLEVAERLISKCADWQARTHHKQDSSISVRGERRRFPRLTAEWLARIDTPHGWVNGWTADISAAGAYIHSQHPVKECEKVKTVFLDVPFLNRPLQVKAEVVRSAFLRTDHGIPFHGFAIHFVDMCKEDRAFLAALISAHLNTAHLWLEPGEPEQSVHLLDSSDRGVAA
jgi:hypothetical protein